MSKKKAVTVPPKLTESDSYDVLRVQNSKPGGLTKNQINPLEVLVLAEQSLRLFEKGPFLRDGPADL